MCGHSCPISWIDINIGFIPPGFCSWYSFWFGIIFGCTTITMTVISKGETKLLKIRYSENATNICKKFVAISRYLNFIFCHKLLPKLTKLHYNFHINIISWYFFYRHKSLENILWKVQSKYKYDLHCSEIFLFLSLWCYDKTTYVHFCFNWNKELPRYFFPEVNNSRYLNRDYKFKNNT